MSPKPTLNIYLFEGPIVCIVHLVTIVIITSVVMNKLSACVSTIQDQILVVSHLVLCDNMVVFMAI
jgi:hypothetical protein